MCWSDWVKSFFTFLGLILQLWLHNFTSTHENKSWTRAVVSEAAALLLLLYLPGGNHCGGSSEPARVASSWVLTPPTQSYPPPLLWFGSPPLVPGWTLGVPGWNVFLRKLPGCSPTDGLRLSPGCCSQAAVSRGTHRPSEESDGTTKEEKSRFGLMQMSSLPLLFDPSALMLLETCSPILGKYCCCLFTPVQSERRSSKVAELLLLAHQRPLSWLAGSLNPARSGAQRLAGVQNFQPIGDAAARDRGADWEKPQTMSALQNLTIKVSKSWKILLVAKESSSKRWQMTRGCFAN